jgi:hypothetical protein
VRPPEARHLRPDDQADVDGPAQCGDDIAVHEPADRGEQPPVGVGPEHGGGVHHPAPGRVEGCEPGRDQRCERRGHLPTGPGEQLLGEERQAVRACVQVPEVLRGQRQATAAGRRERGDVVLAQPAKVQRGGPGQRAQPRGRRRHRRLVPARHGDEHRAVRDGRREVVDDRERVLVGPVQVLEPQQASGAGVREHVHDAQHALPEHDRGVGGGHPGHRAGTTGDQAVEHGEVGPDGGRAPDGGRVEPPDDRLRDRPVAASALHRPAAEHQQPGVGRRVRGRVEQPGLADPGLAEHGQHAPAPGRGVGQQPAHLGQLTSPADDHRAAQHRRHATQYTRMNAVAARSRPPTPSGGQALLCSSGQPSSPHTSDWIASLVAPFSDLS